MCFQYILHINKKIHSIIYIQNNVYLRTKFVKLDLEVIKKRTTTLIDLNIQRKNMLILKQIITLKIKYNIEYFSCPQGINLSYWSF